MNILLVTWDNLVLVKMPAWQRIQARGHHIYKNYTDENLERVYFHVQYTFFFLLRNKQYLPNLFF
jgi:hypothetical protein